MRDFDVVMPKGNEKEFIERAIVLGYSELVFLTDNMNYEYKNIEGTINIKKAFLIRDVSLLNKARSRFDFILANAERKFFEKNVDFILNSELSERKDSFHYRSTLLNQVHAKLADSNNIAIVFNFNILLNSSNKWKRIYLGRMMQNSKLVKKYKLQSQIFSLATSPMEMRSRSSFDALNKIL